MNRAEQQLRLSSESELKTASLDKPGRTSNVCSQREMFSLGGRIGVSLLLFGIMAGLLATAAGVPASNSRDAGQTALRVYVRRFEANYRGLHSLEAGFTQSYFGWGNRRVESGTVYLAPSGKMRWVYEQPQPKIFVCDGKQTYLYVPAEKQVTISPLRGNQDARVPLDILVSHLPLSRVFSRLEFADQALEAEPEDRVIRGYPKAKFSEDFRSCLIELTPRFNVRRLVVLYPDNTTMQFTFNHIERNTPLAPALFAFSPPPGTQVVRQ